MKPAGKCFLQREVKFFFSSNLSLQPPSQDISLIFLRLFSKRNLQPSFSLRLTFQYLPNGLINLVENEMCIFLLKIKDIIH
jgi:hypothetical protein